MPINKLKNVDFFKEWSPQMAYVLGFFAADGSMYVNSRGSHYVSFYSNDREILVKIRSSLGSHHKISQRESFHARWAIRYILQIGSKEMYEDLLALGFSKNKSLTLKFPSIPKPYLNHFIRGYFDGDGNVLFKNYYRKDRGKYKFYLATKFIGGSLKFLAGLQRLLAENGNLGNGSLFQGERCFVLSYAMMDSKKLFAYMYKNVRKDLYLERKYNIFLDAIDNMER